jgi:hypothetical protein
LKCQSKLFCRIQLLNETLSTLAGNSALLSVRAGAAHKQNCRTVISPWLGAPSVLNMPAGFNGVPGNIDAINQGRLMSVIEKTSPAFSS